MSRIDCSTAAGRMMIGVLGSLAEYERELTKERTALKIVASLGGLLLDDTDDALLTYLEREIQPGGRVIWPERDAEGNYLHHTVDGRELVVSGFGTVTAQPDG